MTAGNYLNTAINGAVRVALVIAPSMKAATHLTEMASRTLNAALGLIGLEVKLPALIESSADETARSKATYGSHIYTFLHGYLPATVTSQKDAFKKLSSTDLVKGFAFYTGVAIVSTFVANKFLGQTPEIYNTIAKYAGSALRLDTGYDVIQMAINYVRKT